MYVTLGGWGGWVCANFVINCYEKYRGWEYQITLVTQHQNFSIMFLLFTF